MKHMASMALMLCLGAASAYGQEKPVKMTFSGTAAASIVNLQPTTSSSDEDNFAGDGTLGSFTVRNIRSLPNSPTTSSTCSGSNLLHFTETDGGSVVRFQDGSLLFLHLTEGSDCIDISTGEAHCVLTFQVTGGTGHFKNASGTLTMTETALTVLSDDTGNPVFFAATGVITGTVSGVSEEQQPDEGQ